jgi:predicted secreted Zn-dependent protease
MQKNLSAALLALATLTSGCLPARPNAAASASSTGLQVSFDQAFYDVAGLTARDLNLELGRRGPDHQGVRWQGETRFQVSYSYLPERVDGACRARKPKVAVRLTTTLPNWTNRSEAPSNLQSDWDVYFARLSSHEEGHRRIAISAGEELLRAVEALHEESCEGLHREIVAVARSYQQIVAVEQQGWDDQTSHGIAVGD